jgi:AcrR family transcriptional regulator
MSAAPLPLSARRRGGRTAEAILDAAEALFAERGFEGTALRDVAAGVGVRTPSLYNHFPSKESLYAAVLERGFDPVLELLAGAAPSGGGARDRERVVSEMMAVLARHPHLPRLLLHETLAGGQRLTPMLERWLAPALARAQELIEADPAARAWPRDQIPLLVLALYHAVVGYFTVAGLYRQARGEDLLAEPALARQTAFLRQLVATLFPADTTPQPPRGPERRAP